MTASCPNGHETATIDYCEVCGVKVGGESQPTEVLSEFTSVVTTPPAEQQRCPSCGATRLHGDLFCERCGHDFNGAVEAPAADGWRAIVTADRDQFDSVVADGLEFPSLPGSSQLDLEDDEIAVGREGSDGIRVDDPGASRMHAALLRSEDGSYSVRDRGSTNGTRLNDDPTPISRDAVVPLKDGDRIRVGAWTTITITRRVVDDA